MGRYNDSGKSSLIIPSRHYQRVLEALDYEIDEDKSAEINLIDCLSDFMIKLARKEKNQLKFIVADEESDADFEWDMLLKLTPYLKDGSFYESIEGDQVLVGCVEKGHLERRYYALVEDENGDLVRGDFIEMVDQDLEKD